MDLKSVQKPLKEQYRNDCSASRITLKAKGGQTGTPIACSVAVGRKPLRNHLISKPASILARHSP